MRKTILRSRPWISSGALHAAILLALGMCTFVHHNVGGLSLEITSDDRGSEHLEVFEITPPDVPPADLLTASLVPPPSDLIEFGRPGSKETTPLYARSSRIPRETVATGETPGARRIEFYSAVGRGDRAAFGLDASGTMGHSARKRNFPSRFQLAAEESGSTYRSVP